jgi:hypothetical protein
MMRRLACEGACPSNAGCTIILAGGAPVKTDIAARLDRLPWSQFHLLIVVGLGVTWILDGLEVTIVGALGPALQSAQTLHLSSANLGAVASFYVIGAVRSCPDG